jgi:hypothetical protein
MWLEVAEEYFRAEEYSRVEQAEGAEEYFRLVLK